jgi:hypothetical protein
LFFVAKSNIFIRGIGKMTQIPSHQMAVLQLGNVLQKLQDDLGKEEEKFLDECKAMQQKWQALQHRSREMKEHVTQFLLCLDSLPPSPHRSELAHRITKDTSALSSYNEMNALFNTCL